MFGLIRRWWWAQQRAIDLRILWPICKEKTTSLDQALRDIAAMGGHVGVGGKLLTQLLDELDRWKRALSDTRGTASTCLAMNPTKEQMRRALARIAGHE